MTNEQHNTYLAYAFLGHAAFQLMMLLFMAVMFSFIFFIPVDPGKPEPPREIFGIMIVVMTFFQLAFTTPSIVAAYALLKRKSWARLASIIGAVVAAMSVPFGTAACVYALWFFLGDNWKSIYPDQNDDIARERPQIAYGVESQRAAYEADDRREEERVRTYEPPDWR